RSSRPAKRGQPADSARLTPLTASDGQRADAADRNEDDAARLGHHADDAVDEPDSRGDPGCVRAGGNRVGRVRVDLDVVRRVAVKEAASVEEGRVEIRPAGRVAPGAIDE